MLTFYGRLQINTESLFCEDARLLIVKAFHKLSTTQNNIENKRKQSPTGVIKTVYWDLPQFTLGVAWASRSIVHR